MTDEGRSFSGNERNCCYLNTGDHPDAAGRFANISATSGLDFPDDGRALAVVDWDHDGDQDLWISNRNAPRLRLMRNDVPTGNHFVMLKLQGDGTTTNRDAVGARIEVLLENPNSEIGTSASVSHPKSIKTLRAGEGFLAQSSKWLHFGLGTAQAIKEVRVRWPGGSTESFTGLQIDGRYRLVQGSSKAVEAKRRTAAARLVASDQAVLPPSSVARVPMVELLKVPTVPYVDSEGRQRTLPTESPGVVLINLWSRSCAPCLKELNDFAGRYDEIQAQGIEILALSIDELVQETSVGGSLAKLIFKFKHDFPFQVGRATEELLTDFQHLCDVQFARHRQLPLPSSFLLDDRGRLAVIYKGPVSVDQLLQDVAHSSRNRTERLEQSAPVVGRSIPHPRIERTAIDLGVYLRFRVAEKMKASGRMAEAAAQYADVLEIHPENAEARNNLGNVLQQQGKLVDAIEHYHRALRIKPDDAVVHNNLGNALQRQGKHAEAIEHFRRALRITPDYADAHYNLANALHRQGRLVEATEQFHQILRMWPDFADAHHNLGTVFAARNRYNDALRHLRKSVELNPGNEQFRQDLSKAERLLLESQNRSQP